MREVTRDDILDAVHARNGRVSRRRIVALRRLFRSLRQEKSVVFCDPHPWHLRRPEQPDTLSDRQWLGWPGNCSSTSAMRIPKPEERFTGLLSRANLAEKLPAMTSRPIPLVAGYADDGLCGAPLGALHRPSLPSDILVPYLMVGRSDLHVVASCVMRETASMVRETGASSRSASLVRCLMLVSW